MENYRCRSYIYAPDGHGFSPLAQLNGRGRGGQIYYYFNDQLGTPQELVTVNGDIVWSAVYKSYGNLAVEYQAVPQPIRLPGQYFDEESGLHYNRYRYYDPYSARYFSQDPIGLAGGVNLYQYTPNPLIYTDPLGLITCGGTSKSNNNVLYHYTDEKGLNGILKTQSLKPSLKANNPKDARYGNGQYLSDVLPGTRTNAQLSHDFLGIPFQGKKFENYIAIDTTGLTVTKGRDGVFVILNEGPLDISGRIVRFGRNQP